MPSDHIEFAPHPALVREQKWKAVVQAHIKGGKSGAKKAFLKHFGPDSSDDFVPDEADKIMGKATPKPPGVN